MQAIGIAKTGDLDVIEKMTLPVPEPKPHEVLIKVEYGGVNFMDVLQRQGLYPMPPLPASIGVEASGTIVKLPTDEKILSSENFKSRGLKVGTRVALFSYNGAFSEYMTAAWIHAIPLPDEVSSRDGAAVLVTGITAITFIDEAYKVQKGDYVLVHTVAGGVGLCFSQLIAARGGIVIGTTSTAEKAAVAKAHGAAHVILYKDEDVVARVLEITDGQGVHAIFDGVGKDTFEANFKMIRNTGSIVIMGAASGRAPAFSPHILSEKNVKLMNPSAANYLVDPVIAQRYLEELYRVVANGALKVIVSKEYPFTPEGVQASQKDIAGGKNIGKLLIKVA